MKNLQELFDAYLKTKPSAEKIRSATSMMIHIGKALDVANQEEINSDYFPEVVRVLDEFFHNSPQKATLDKAILAEMIGRIGPKPGISVILENLLADEDENVRQYTLQSLEYYGKKSPRTVFKYLEKYRKSNDSIMISAAAALAAKVFNSAEFAFVLTQLEHWCAEGDLSFMEEVLTRIKRTYSQGNSDEYMPQSEFKSWISKNCKHFAQFV
jgi:hypothetical protein